jgi:hypothetical protein
MGSPDPKILALPPSENSGIQEIQEILEKVILGRGAAASLSYEHGELFFAGHTDGRKFDRYGGITSRVRTVRTGHIFLFSTKQI